MIYKEFQQILGLLLPLATLLTSLTYSSNALACQHQNLAWMMLVAPDNLKNPAMTTKYLEFLATKNPGATIVIKGQIEHLKSEQALKSFFWGIKNSSSALIALDQEGGKIQTITENQGFFKIPSMAEVGRANDINLTKSLGRYMGIKLREYGVDWNLAPVADLAIAHNPVITNLKRGFSADPNIVALHTSALVSGLSQAGIISTLKHFPGHGHTLSDSHHGRVEIDLTKDQLRNSDWRPYLNSLDAAPSIMSAHVSFSSICNNEPASLSFCFINTILRQELKYLGLVVTDALRMKAIANHYSGSQAVIKAIEASNDLIMVDFENADEIAQQVCQKAETDPNFAQNLKLSRQRLEALKAKFDPKKTNFAAYQLPQKSLDEVLTAIKYGGNLAH